LGGRKKGGGPPIAPTRGSAFCLKRRLIKTAWRGKRLLSRNEGKMIPDARSKEGRGQERRIGDLRGAGRKDAKDATRESRWKNCKERGIHSGQDKGNTAITELTIAAEIWGKKKEGHAKFRPTQGLPAVSTGRVLALPPQGKGAS